jgi:hypothetical protein
MRPPAPMTRQWVSEKNSFPVRGLVMYRWPQGHWACNIELLRVAREEIDKKPAGEVAYEIALSALHRHMTNTPGHTYDGETMPIPTVRGTIVEVPKLAFELAKILSGKVMKLIEEGGGGINLGTISGTQRLHARATTGSAKGAEAWNMPKLVHGEARKEQRLAHEASASRIKAKAMNDRRKMLAKFWLKNTGGFYRRGLVFTTDSAHFWKFNMEAAMGLGDPVPSSSTDEQSIRELAMSVSHAAIEAFASAVNIEKGDDRFLRRDKYEGRVDEALTQEILDTASERLAKRLLQGMQKHKHGIIGLSVIERCLVLAWDPLDTKPLDEYPFPFAPSATPQELDRWALDTLHDLQSRVRRPDSKRASQAAAPGEPTQELPVQTQKSWREELEINDWVPLEEPIEDDETIDRRAMQLADHEQSAALRRIRDEAGGSRKKQVGTASVKHDIDYAGLPKDVD